MQAQRASTCTFKIARWCTTTTNATSTYASSSAIPAASKDGVILSLERSIFAGDGEADLPLRSTAAFNAEVFPDLPVATTWKGLWRQLTRPGSHHHVDNTAVMGPADTAPDVLKVITIGANLRKMQDIEGHVRAATVPPPGASGRAADALLLLSGSHPFRSIPGYARLLPNSLNLLQLASKLRSQGAIPHTTQLWAVANPNTEANAAYAAQKVEQGAQVLVTQPPFDMEAFQAWWQDAQARGVMQAARVVVGHPMISSASSLSFWLTLSNSARKPACGALMAQFKAAEREGKEALRAHCVQYNVRLTEQVLQLPKVSGFHVMPITPRSKLDAIDAVQPGGMLHHMVAPRAAK